MHVNGCISSNLSDVFPSLPFQDPIVNSSLSTNVNGISASNSSDAVSRLKYLGLNMPQFANLSSNNNMFFNEDRSRTNLIINYLPQSYDQNDLQRLFERVGPIRQCKLIRDKHAALAIQTYHGYETEQKRLRVAYASSGGLAHRLPTLSNGSNFSGVLGSEVTNENTIGWEIFVIGIPLECSESDLLRLFNNFGSVILIRLLAPQLSESPPIQKSRMSPNFNGASSDMSSDSIDNKLTTSASVIFEEKSSAELAIMRLNGYQAPEWTVPMRLRIIGSVSRETYSLFCNPSRQSPVLSMPKANGHHISDPLTESDVFGNMINRRILNASNCVTNSNNQNPFLPIDITKNSELSLSSSMDANNLHVNSSVPYAQQPRPIIRNKTSADSISGVRENLSTNSFDLLDLFDGQGVQSNLMGSDRFASREISLVNSLNQHLIEQDRSKVDNSLRTMVTSQSSLWSVSQNRSVLSALPEADRVTDNSLQKRLSVKTPLLHSALLTNTLMQRGANINIWLKLENVQPTGSFKIRGTEKACRKWSEAGVNHIVCPSNGNTAMAAAFAARAYGMNCTVVVPESCESMIRKHIALEAPETKVIAVGSSFLEVDLHAQHLVNELQQMQNSSVRLLHPYDQSELWEGYESIIDELSQEISQPDAIVVAVGGGGLLTGIIQGLWNKGWTSTHIVVAETEETDCFNRSWRSGQIVVIPRSSTVATSLNAPLIAHRTWKLAQCHSVSPVTCTDGEAVEATRHFLDDHGMLVEPASGAALSTVYSGYLASLQHEGRLPRPANVVVLVGGGRNVSLRQLIDWENQLTSLVPEQIAASVLSQSASYMPRVTPHSMCAIGQLSLPDHDDKLVTSKSGTPRITRPATVSDNVDNQSNHNNDRDNDLVGNNNFSGVLNPHDLVNFSKLLSTHDVDDDDKVGVRDL